MIDDERAWRGKLGLLEAERASDGDLLGLRAPLSTSAAEGALLARRGSCAASPGALARELPLRFRLGLVLMAAYGTLARECRD